MMMKQLNQRGQAMMATVVTVGVVAMIFIAAIVFKTTTSQRSGTRAQKSIAAYEIANAAVQKGIWALNLNSSNWASLSNGEYITGYKGDKVYTDIPGGSYVLWITSGPTSNDRTIVAFAKDDTKSPQYRGLKVVLTAGSAQWGALMGKKINLKGRAKVHWGPIYAYDTLNIDKKSRNFYPRLFSKGKIKHIDNSPSAPNTDSTFWWSFNAPPGVPTWPAIDFEFYKAIAKSQGNYYAKDDRKKNVTHNDDRDNDKDGHPQLDDKDKSDDDSYSYTNIIDTQPYVRFYDTGVKAKFKGGKNLLRGVIIAMDTLEFADNTATIADVNAKYAASSLSPYYPRAVSIPTTAWKEYKKIDTSSSWDYPGDTGGPGTSGLSATYTFGAATTNNLQSTARIHFEGFMYAGKQLKLHRGGLILGTVMTADNNTELKGQEDKDQTGDDDKDCDHKSRHDKDDDKDHHDTDPTGGFTHKTHEGCDQGNSGAERRLNIYWQDNLGIKILGSGQKQTLWQEVPAPEF